MFCHKFVFASCITALAATGLCQSYPPCSQEHVGKQHRLESVAKNGDARMAKSAGGHAVLYAIEKYGLKGVITKAETDKAIDQMYNFLKWKMYTPTAVATQFVTAGYQHFDKAYSDEAAAALLGILDSYDQPKIVLPEYLTLYMAATLTGTLSNATVELLIAELEKMGLPDITAGLERMGVPEAVAKQWGGDISRRIAQKAIGESIGVINLILPRDFDVDNRLVAFAMEGKKAMAGVIARSGGTRGGGLPAEGKTRGTGTGTTGGSSGGISTAEADALKARIDELEKLVADLRAEIATLKENKAKGDGPLEPTTSGYEEVHMKVTLPSGGKLTVKVNGTVVASYTTPYSDVVLDSFLKPGFVNRLSFTFSDSTGKDADVRLVVRANPTAAWTHLFSFVPGQEKEGLIEVPFVAKK